MDYFTGGGPELKNKPFTSLFKTTTAVFLVVVFVLAVMPLVITGDVPQFLLGLAIWIGLTVYCFLTETKREKALQEYIQNLSFYADEAGRNSLVSLPLPISVLNTDGSVIWYNELFRDIFELDGLQDVNLNDLLEVDVNKLIEKTSSEKKIVYKGKHYKLVVNHVDRNESNLAVLYWIDDTRFENLKTAFENSRPVVCSLTIDNYEEVMQHTDDEAKTVLIGTVEKKITDWAIENQGAIKKIERDKFFIVFSSLQLRKVIESKFTILDEVKNISLGNRIPVTISMGIGTGADNNIYADDISARNALNMALGRGGDQAVIKNEDGFKYFGGNSKELEKYTRVKTRVMAYALKQLMGQSEQVMIMGHKNADLDSFGAAIGMCSAAMEEGKPSYIVLETSNAYTNKLKSQFEKTEKFAGVFIDRETALARITPTTLLIIVDVFKPVITEEPQLIEKTNNIVVIDHHRKSSDFIENASLTYHEPSASSACEMVTELLQYMNDGKSITKNVAEALFAGVELDTKGFSFKTGVRTFEAAAYLRRKGVDASNIKVLFQTGRTEYAIRSEIVKSAEIYNGFIAISSTDSEYEDIQSLTAAAADDLLDIEGIVASFTMCRVNGVTYISGRSLGNINVQMILELIGGGGHHVVAGAQLDCKFEEAKTILKQAIDEYFENNRKG